MTKEEYKERFEELRKEFDNKKKELAKEYSFANNPYKVGDILKDHSVIIKVEKIICSCTTFNYPECAYIGTQLTSKLVPRKKQESTIMFQSNVVKKLK